MSYVTVCVMILSHVIVIQAHTPCECEIRKLILRADSALHSF